jgi:diadenosine tetraphosphate (Ap4A) HIT family hydrolase
MCRFCDIQEDEKVILTEYFFAIIDRAPVNKGHMLIIPKRHQETLFSLHADEWADLQRALIESRKYLDEEFQPGGYNIGVNSGEVAGQTVMHLHVHIIPRYIGDVENPRGGIRNLKKPVTDLWPE